jgi:hypothetical protein
MSRTTQARTVRAWFHERIAVSSTGSSLARSSTSPRTTWSTSARSTFLNTSSLPASVATL